MTVYDHVGPASGTARAPRAGGGFRRRWYRGFRPPWRCMATSGPGATNLITGIANAYLDSVPMIAITGQVATPLMGTDAFQEVDIFGMTLPVVKHSYVARHVEDLPCIVDEAWQIASSGRPGPVLIDLPKNIAAGAVEAARPAVPHTSIARPLDMTALAHAAALIGASARFSMRGGIALAVPRTFRNRLATGIPVVSTSQASAPSQRSSVVLG